MLKAKYRVEDLRGSDRGDYLVKAVSRIRTKFKLTSEGDLISFASDLAKVYSCIRFDQSRQDYLVEKGGKTIEESHWLMGVLERDRVVSEYVLEKIEKYSETFSVEFKEAVSRLIDDAIDASKERFEEWLARTDIKPSSEFR